MNPRDWSDEEWAVYLTRCLERDRPVLQELNGYYEGSQKLSYMHPEVLAELGSHLRQVVINWPRLVVDSLEERLDIEGFRFSASGDSTTEDDNAGDADENLWRIWQANNMDEASQQAHVDALVMKRAFITVGTDEDDPETPKVTAESPLQMYADFDPGTRKVRAALKRWHERDPLTYGIKEQYATLYLPDRTVWYEFKTPTSFKKVHEDAHMMGVVPVAPLVNRGRILDPAGVSELMDIIPISDAACKIASDMMVSAEYHAMPRRWALGMGEEDFQDEKGNKISPWKRLAGHLWATAKTKQDDGVELGQFPEATLNNFHETINILAKLCASMGALPPHFLGMDTQNPASADAIRSAESRLVKRAERKHRPFGGGAEQAMRIVLRILDGDWDPKAKSLETLWRDPATPTYAQKADAVVKLHAAGILPTAQAREDLGYTSVQRARMEQMDEEEVGQLSPLDMISAGGVLDENGDIVPGPATRDPHTNEGEEGDDMGKMPVKNDAKDPKKGTKADEKNGKGKGKPFGK